MHRKLQESRSIFLSFSLILILIFLLSGVSIFKILELSSLVEKFNDHPLIITHKTQNIQKELISMHRYMKDVVLSRNPQELETALRMVSINEKQILKNYNVVFSRYLGDKKDVQKSYNLFMDWQPIRKEVVTLILAKKYDKALHINQNRAAQHLTLLNESVDVLINFAGTKADAFVSNSLEIKNHSFITISVLTLFIFITVIVIMRVLLQKIKDNKAKRIKQEQEFINKSRLVQMGEMISMIAHQWRQPLSAIAASSMNLQTKIQLNNFDTSTLIGKKELDAYFIKNLQKIDGFVRNLTETIDDFRNFYKPNKQTELCSLSEITQNSLAIIKASFIANNIKIIEDYISENKYRLYKNEIMQVLLNLLKNAEDNFIEKQTKNPSITIIVRENTIQVCDNGGGIQDTVLEKIFDPYFSTKTEKNGTGLGLYMSKIIVEEHHNGRLLAKNYYGDNDEVLGVCLSIHLD